MWRSFLFIPVLEQRFIAKAADCHADAIILDLEASIAADRKPEARTALPDVVSRLTSQVDVTVRINPLWLDAIRDLEACVIDGVTALHLALCESAEQVAAIDGILTELERERGLPPGKIKLIAMLESPGAVLRAEGIARASPRMAGLTLGVEDYATAMGASANDVLLRPAGAQVIQAARAAGVEPLVVPSSMADFRDFEALALAADFARNLGASGGYAVHPGQVEVLNRSFTPTETEIDWATRVLAAAAEAAKAGQGVFQIDGQMIDLPLVTRAERIIRRTPPT
ncbi:HpcH/HpaI aldolase/citrate lyase family protein [Shimia thalassica]|uniref:HpcH/HpaI aldolase/citrate lyase family protein n=1 Tax=Shimia thalassica TaxID=1715693 RepID=UPI0026E15D9E|nr:CoA ester lyase [Shimia thalassica]MDO6485945.1 CoA ester lyase [Shimia thalassica]MDO6800382.1 CoA ester lyase [Shimia thalassica]